MTDEPRADAGRAEPERVDARRAEPDPADGQGADAVDEYAGGEIRSYRGRVDRWLLVVYVGLALWGVYYLVAYWGGLGPGQGR